MIGSSTSAILGGASEDRVSGMPKDVIDMILETLPIRDAVRTSVLSRKWQYHWVTASELVFSDQFFKSLSIEYLTDLQVKNIINKILLLHTGPLRKFTLDIDPALSLKDDLDQWIPILSRKGIKEFTLLFPGEDFYQLGIELYSCLELTYLIIANCTLNPPAAFEGFPNLTTLELFLVSVNGKFADAISACPRLESVSILVCNGIYNLVVGAPNLKYLRAERVEGLKTVCLNSAKNLATLFISFSHAAVASRIEKLCLGNNILEFSVPSSIPKRLSISLDKLKKIVLSQVDLGDAAQMACTLCMIQSSPRLSELEIWGQISGSAIGPYHNFVEDYVDHDCSFGLLQNVKLMLLKDSKADMALIKFLLAHSPALEHMYIQTSNSFDKNMSLSMRKTTMGFGRASPKAVIDLQFGAFTA